MDELEELDNERREELVVRGRIVGEGEANGSDDGRAGVARVGGETRLELGKVLGGVGDRELTEAVGCDVPRALLLRLAVLEERNPERVGDFGQRSRLTVADDLERKSLAEVYRGRARVRTSFRACSARYRF